MARWLAVDAVRLCSWRIRVVITRLRRVSRSDLPVLAFRMR